MLIAHDLGGGRQHNLRALANGYAGGLIGERWSREKGMALLDKELLLEASKAGWTDGFLATINGNCTRTIRGIRDNCAEVEAEVTQLLQNGGRDCCDRLMTSVKKAGDVITVADAIERLGVDEDKAKAVLIRCQKARCLKRVRGCAIPTYRATGVLYRYQKAETVLDRIGQNIRTLNGFGRANLADVHHAKVNLTEDDFKKLEFCLNPALPALERLDGWDKKSRKAKQDEMHYNFFSGIAVVPSRTDDKLSNLVSALGDPLVSQRIALPIWIYLDESHAAQFRLDEEQSRPESIRSAIGNILKKASSKADAGAAYDVFFTFVSVNTQQEFKQL